MANIRNFDRIANELIIDKINNTNPLLTSSHTVDDDYFKQFYKYEYNPLLYFKEILGVRLWSKQVEIVEKLIQKRKVLVRSSHLVGKSFISACLANYFFDTSSKKLIGTISAPTNQQLTDVLFAEMRRVRKTKNFFSGTVKTELKSDENRFIAGVTTSDSQALAGRHAEKNIVIFDEASEMKKPQHDVFETLLENDFYALYIYNPVKNDAFIRTLENSEDHHLITISALEHPNIQRAIANYPDVRPVIKGAITLDRFVEMLMNYQSTIVSKEYSDKTSIYLPDKNGEWHYIKPSPTAQSRLLGSYGDVSDSNVWSDYLIDLACKPIDNYDYSSLSIEDQRPVIGIDMARYGNDNIAIAIKEGYCVTDVSEYSKMDATEILPIIQLKLNELAFKHNTTPDNVSIRIDANGIGVALCDVLKLFQIKHEEVMVSTSSYQPEKYRLLRDELWFNTVDMVKQNKCSFSLLPDTIVFKLRNELLSPSYQINEKGQIVVESKLSMRQKRKKSPNIADAINLLFYNPTPNITISVV